MYTAPYCPDLNPIEYFFLLFLAESQNKHFLHRHTVRLDQMRAGGLGEREEPDGGSGV